MQSKHVNNVIAAIALVLLVALAFRAWEKEKAQPDPNTQIVRTYTVPEGRAEEIRSVLSRLFWQKDQDNPVASTQIFGNGVLVVRAPIAYQNGIGNLVAKISQDALGPAVRDVHERVHLDYWLVLGETTGKANGDTFGDLSPVLDSIAKVDGTRKFRVIEHIGSSSSLGAESDVRGNIAEIKNVAHKSSDDQILLDFSARAHNVGDVTTKTLIKSGEFVVLGQNSLHPDPELLKELHGPAAWAENPPNVYHVIRIDTQ